MYFSKFFKSRYILKLYDLRKWSQIWTSFYHRFLNQESRPFFFKCLKSESKPLRTKYIDMFFRIIEKLQREKISYISYPKDLRSIDNHLSGLFETIWIQSEYQICIDIRFRFPQNSKINNWRMTVFVSVMIITTLVPYESIFISKSYHFWRSNQKMKNEIFL